MGMPRPDLLLHCQQSVHFNSPWERNMSRALSAVLPLVLLSACGSEAPANPDAQRYASEEGRLRIALVKQPYHGSRNVPERSRNPDYLEEGGIAGALTEAGHELLPVQTVVLTPEEEGEYGEWHRLGLANGHLADVVARNEIEGFLTIGLLANCNALMGMLGGYQHAHPSEKPLEVGLVWIDAHGDFNTPETTLSGMLGGMPVAVSAGLALHRLRRESSLDPPISTDHILMVAVRDTDPEEEVLIQAHGLARITTQDVRDRSPALDAQMQRLSDISDLIYVHVDMDVLDPREVQGHGLTVADGPTSQELAAALTEMFRYPKVAGLGIASTPAYDADAGELSRQAAYRLIEGALAGVQAR
jgi:arginase